MPQQAFVEADLGQQRAPEVHRVELASVKGNPAQLHTAEVARTVSLVVGALLAIGLWLWMAWANGKGRSWARILSAVFFAINTLDLIASFVLVQGTASQIAGVVIWLIGLAVIVLIFSKDSGPFYQQQAAQQ